MCKKNLFRSEICSTGTNFIGNIFHRKLNLQKICSSTVKFVPELIFKPNVKQIPEQKSQLQEFLKVLK